MKNASVVGLCAGLLAALVVGCGEPEADNGVYPEPAGPWVRAVEAGADAGALLSVWGRSSEDVWSVGGQVSSVADAGRGAIFRRRGGEWTLVQTPDGTPLLNWVHGRDDEIWAVGNVGTALRYDGSTWQSVDTGVDVPLWGVFVFGPSDVWAAGGDAFDQDTDGILLHYDGSTWSGVSLPELDRDSAANFKVFGVNPDDIHVVGSRGVLLHYDGSRWTQEPSGTSSDMISLWGNDPDDVIAVGGRAVGTIARWNGAVWNTEEVGVLPGLNGVWMDPEGRASVVGNNGVAAVVRDGFSAELEDSTISFEVLHAVFGLEDGTRISVGGTLNASPPYTGIILENTP